MAKKKKKKTIQSLVPTEPELTEGQYYWCVSCGHHGDYGFIRKNSIRCELCNYDVVLYELEEINDPNYDNVWLERFKTKAKALKGQETKTETKDYKEKSDTSNIQAKIEAIRDI